MLQHTAIRQVASTAALPIHEEEEGAPRACGGAVSEALPSPSAPSADPTPIANEDSAEALAPLPVSVGGDGVAPEAAPEAGWACAAAVADPAVAGGEIDPARILRDRPDVFAAYYSEFYGAHNDRNSPAWLDRVGGEAAEDYARYWYETYGRYEGYAQDPARAAAPVEGAGDPALGRTTIDGIPLSNILTDRPDVFRAFFTEYYGANNDRNSDAWIQRVGGATVEDYANYWYNAHGRMEGYVPAGSRSPAAPATDPIAAPDPIGGEGREPLRAEDPSLDPWNHPAIYPDWRPPYPGWQPPTGVAPPEEASPVPTDPAASPAIADDYPFARPLVVHPSEDGFELLPATLDEIAALRSLFDDAVI